MKNVCIIGSGNIGSRHLQGLKKVSFPLSIEIVDPSSRSLEIAKERYNQINSPINHKIIFLKDLNKISKKIDLAIIATSSNIRREVVEKLLRISDVQYLILEKILFQKRKDYFGIEKLLKQKKVTGWVNFSMRTMPFYNQLKDKLQGRVQMNVSGSQYGLITNAIHFIDYIAFLTNCYDFKVITDGLNRKVVESKRVGFSELNGTLFVTFQDGSTGCFTCLPNGEAPFMIEVSSSNYRCISKESERKAWISFSKNDWQWDEIQTNIPFQSDMTNLVVEEILEKGSCQLTSYSEASKIHLQFLESLLNFLNESSSQKYDYYPFT